MAYEGEELYLCPEDIEFTVTWAVVVSGASWNPCGHMLLCCGSSSENAWYFHVSGQGMGELWGVRAYPKFMREAGYRRYLIDNNKYEIRRLDARIRNPQGAYQRLTNYMANPWVWGVLINNCATFVREIIEGGEGSLSVILNCPDQEARIPRRIRRLGGLPAPHRRFGP